MQATQPSSLPTPPIRKNVSTTYISSGAMIIQYLCPVHLAIVNSEKYTCIHKRECPISECQYCEIDEGKTYEDKVKFILFVEDLVMMFNKPGSRANYHPIIPRIDPEDWEES